MGKTSYLQLNTTSEGDGATTNFLTWRLLQNSPTSVSGCSPNTTIIDNWAQSVSGSITSVSASTVPGGAGHTHVSGSGGTISHANLSGLVSPADDHTQYLLAAGGRSMSGSLLVLNSAAVSTGLSIGYQTASAGTGEILTRSHIAAGSGIVIGATSSAQASDGALAFYTKAAAPSNSAGYNKLANVDGVLTEINSSGSSTTMGWGKLSKITGLISNPQAVYDTRPQVAIFRTNAATKISRIYLSTNSVESGSQVRNDLYYASDTQSFSACSLIANSTTTSGTFTDITNHYIPSSKFIILQINQSPAIGVKDLYFEIYYNYC